LCGAGAGAGDYFHVSLTSAIGQMQASPRNGVVLPAARMGTAGAIDSLKVNVATGGSIGRWCQSTTRTYRRCFFEIKTPGHPVRGWQWMRTVVVPRRDHRRDRLTWRCARLADVAVLVLRVRKRQLPTDVLANYICARDGRFDDIGFAHFMGREYLLRERPDPAPNVSGVIGRRRGSCGCCSPVYVWKSPPIERPGNAFCGRCRAPAGADDELCLPDCKADHAWWESNAHTRCVYGYRGPLVTTGILLMIAGGICGFGPCGRRSGTRWRRAGVRWKFDPTETAPLRNLAITARGSTSACIARPGMCSVTQSSFVCSTRPSTRVGRFDAHACLPLRRAGNKSIHALNVENSRPGTRQRHGIPRIPKRANSPAS